MIRGRQKFERQKRKTVFVCNLLFRFSKIETFNLLILFYTKESETIPKI